MKKFLIISLLVCLALPAMPCIYLGRPHYYVFSAFNRDQMGSTYDARVNQFWADYTGLGEDARWEVSGLSYVDPDDFAKSNNNIIKTALKKRDNEAIAYLKQLVKYLKISNQVQGEDWEYPTREELAERGRNLSTIRTAALAYKGYRFRPQYELLVMRTYMLQQSYASIKQYWMSTASKLPESVYKDMMKGIYAGALYHTGSRDVACKMYAELGDMQSIKWCVRDKRNLKGIKEEYAADPNSPTLIFLVQDFVNNAQETRDHNSDPDEMKWIEATSIHDNELNGFLRFAEQVEAEGKTTVPALWHSAAGFIYYFKGDYNRAVAMLDEAQRMEGTQRMKDNARACRLIACAHAGNFDDSYFDNITNEMAWLKTKISDNDPHYREVMQRLVYDELEPCLRQNGKTSMATALLAWARDNGYEDYDSDYSTAIEGLTAQQLLAYKAYFDAAPTNSFERMLHTGMKATATDELNDLVGTKYLREGDFASAIPYLEKVPLSYLSQQGISRYAAVRDFKRDRWFGRQVVDRNWDEWASNETATVKQNAKLLFCREMLDLLERYGNATGEERLQLAYTLGSRYYQASYRGDCWYLTHYSNSVYEEAKEYELDFVAVARIYLNEAKRTENFELKQKSLYAYAFITQGPLGEACVYAEHDWANDKDVWHLRRDVPNYDPMLDLSNFAKAHAGQTASYVSKCDYLRRFQQLY